MNNQSREIAEKAKEHTTVNVQISPMYRFTIYSVYATVDVRAPSARGRMFLLVILSVDCYNLYEISETFECWQ